jgi:hypothetical protein
MTDNWIENRETNRKARKHTYTATNSAGATVTRTTHRTYAFAVVHSSPTVKLAESWCGRLDLAQKRVAELNRIYPSAVYEILPAKLKGEG